MYLSPAFILCLGVSVPQTGTGAFLSECDKMEQEILSQLKQEAMWKDPKKKADLLRCLEIGRRLRAKALVPVLIPWLNYTPFGPDGDALKTVEERFPVLAVLSEIGAPAVPALLRLLATADPSDIKKDGQQKHALAVLCLRKIYEPGGYARELARQRIELEAKKSTGKEKTFLEEASKHPSLKD